MNTCRTRWKGSGVSPGEYIGLFDIEHIIRQLELDNTQYSRH